MRSFLPLLFLALSFSACESSNSVEQSFFAMVDAGKSLDTDGIDSLLNETSKNYLQQVLDNARTDDLHSSIGIGESLEVPLTTMMWHETFKSFFADDTLSQKKYQDILLLLVFDGEGIFRLLGTANPTINKSASFDDQGAHLPVNIPTGNGNVFIVTTYDFTKEDDVWKLDYPSSLRMKEKILRQEQVRSGLDSYTFAKRMAENGIDELTFSYRRSFH